MASSAHYILVCIHGALFFLLHNIKRMNLKCKIKWCEFFFFWFVNESRVKLTLENVKNAENYSV